jgi:acyl carrier protein
MLDQRVIAVIAKFQKISPEQITLDSTFAELGIDSLQGLNLLYELETEFNVNIPNPTGMNITSVRDLVKGLEPLLAARPAVVVN